MKRHIFLTGQAVLVFLSFTGASFAGDIQQPTKGSLPSDVSKGKGPISPLPGTQKIEPTLPSSQGVQGKPAQGTQGKASGLQGGVMEYPICSSLAKVYPLDSAWGFENGMSCRFASLDAASQAQRFPLCTASAIIYQQDPSWGWENEQSCWRGNQGLQPVQGAQKGLEPAPSAQKGSLTK